MVVFGMLWWCKFMVVKLYWVVCLFGVDVIVVGVVLFGKEKGGFEL